jgi:signal transduction histidine kinase
MSARPVGDAALVRRTRWRLLAWSGGSTLSILVLLGSLLYAAVANSLSGAAEDQLRARAGELEAGLVVRQTPGFPPASGQGSPNALVVGNPAVPGYAISGGAVAGTLAVVVMPDGATYPDVRRVYGSRLSDELSLVEAAAAGGVESFETPTIDGTPLRILTKEIPAGDQSIVMQVVADRIAEERTLSVLIAVLAVGGLVVLAASLGVGWIYAERALVPIRDAMRRQRDFAADASHELRTPLSVVKGSVAHLRRHHASPVADVGEALDDIESEVDRLGALVDDLLLLARTDSGTLELELGPTDLGEVALDAAGTLAALAGEREVRLEVDAEPLAVTGDGGRLRQLVRILVDNAIRHGPPGSTVRVAARRVDGRARLVVEDEGQGFAPADLPRVFERFWRAPGEHTGGTGLGLAIAAWIVDRHGGEIEAANRTAGSGARMEVRLPLA